MIDILLAILATYRIAEMLTSEEGPVGVFALMRERIDPTQASWVGRGINCPLCVGFWIAAIMALLLAPATLQAWLLSWWGIAGGAMILDKILMAE